MSLILRVPEKLDKSKGGRPRKIKVTIDPLNEKYRGLLFSSFIQILCCYREDFVKSEEMKSKFINNYSKEDPDLTEEILHNITKYIYENWTFNSCLITKESERTNDLFKKFVKNV